MTPNILEITDILFYISAYLRDKDAFNLFTTNKYFYSLLQKYPHRYTIKKLVKDTDYAIVTKNYTISRYNHTINLPISYLPPKLTHLKLGDRFNFPVRDLPSTITHLIFGIRFNSVIENYPANLKYLYFGCAFNQELKDLPKGLKKIVVGRYYNKSTKNISKDIKFIK